MFSFGYLHLSFLIKNLSFPSPANVDCWANLKYVTTFVQFESKVESFQVTEVQKNVSTEGCPSVDSCKKEYF